MVGRISEQRQILRRYAFGQPNAVGGDVELVARVRHAHRVNKEYDAAAMSSERCTIHTDDTPAKVPDTWRKQKYAGRFWPYVGDPLHPPVVFDFTTTRQREGPAAFLKDYRGYLQPDAFGGYDGICLESPGSIVEVGRWAHARRKFHERRRLDAIRMETALAWINQIYAIEKNLRQRCTDEWASLSLAPGRRPGCNSKLKARQVASPENGADQLARRYPAWQQVSSATPQQDRIFGGCHRSGDCIPSAVTCPEPRGYDSVEIAIGACGDRWLVGLE